MVEKSHYQYFSATSSRTAAAGSGAVLSQAERDQTRSATNPPTAVQTSDTPREQSNPAANVASQTPPATVEHPMNAAGRAALARQNGTSATTTTTTTSSVPPPPQQPTVSESRDEFHAATDSSLGTGEGESDSVSSSGFRRRIYSRPVRLRLPSARNAHLGSFVAINEHALAERADQDTSSSADNLEDIPSEQHVTAVAGGYCFSLVVDTRGRCYSIGFNDMGQLGLGHRFMQGQLQRIPVFDALFPHRQIKQVAAGVQAAAALAYSGDVWVWGCGVFGLGLGDTEDQLKPRRITNIWNVTLPDEPPLPVDLVMKAPIVQLVAGSHHFVCQDEGGAVYSFGHGEYGQQGTGDEGESGATARHGHALPHLVNFTPSATHTSTAKQAAVATQVAMIGSGSIHTFLVTVDRQLYSFGWNSAGVLGHGDRRFRVLPTHVMALEGERVLSVAGGWKHSIAVVESESATFAFDFQHLCNPPHARLRPSLSGISEFVPALNINQPDLAFVVENKPIFVHRAFVASRCRRIAAMIAMTEKYGGKDVRMEPDTAESNPEEFVRAVASTRNGDPTESVQLLQGSIEALAPLVIQVSGPRFVVFAGLCAYLYTDHVRIPTFFLRELAQLAQQYGLPRLVLLCKRQSMQHHTPAEGESAPMSTFAADMEGLVASPRFADVVIDIGKASIPAHRMILSARCPYFRALFEGALAVDSGTRVIRIAADADDGLVNDAEPEETFLNPSTVHDLLMFIYTGNRDVIGPENAADLLAASDYFMMHDLKQVCEAELIRCLAPDNVQVLQQYADAYRAMRLRHECRKVEV
ncbi:hypothetical protein, variant [Capsaspora owczarzaki ATCC 30864]|nr:hypothetical protein, variant [Capsaspora owczarzaki ATCC 30864]